MMNETGPGNGWEVVEPKKTLDIYIYECSEPMEDPETPQS